MICLKAIAILCFVGVVALAWLDRDNIRWRLKRLNRWMH